MNFFRVLRAVFREIFEESAYERFCAREGVTAGCESYAKFIAENAEARNKKFVRCC